MRHARPSGYRANIHLPSPAGTAPTSRFPKPIYRQFLSRSGQRSDHCRSAHWSPCKLFLKHVSHRFPWRRNPHYRFENPQGIPMETSDVDGEARTPRQGRPDLYGVRNWPRIWNIDVSPAPNISDHNRSPDWAQTSTAGPFNFSRKSCRQPIALGRSGNTTPISDHKSGDSQLGDRQTTLAESHQGCKKNVSPKSGANDMVSVKVNPLRISSLLLPPTGLNLREKWPRS